MSFAISPLFLDVIFKGQSSKVSKYVLSQYDWKYLNVLELTKKIWTWVSNPPLWKAVLEADTLEFPIGMFNIY